MLRSVVNKNELVMELKPSQIYYSQESINNVFDKRSAHSCKRIGDTLDDLCDHRSVYFYFSGIKFKNVHIY